MKPEPQTRGKKKGTRRYVPKRKAGNVLLGIIANIHQQLPFDTWTVTYPCVEPGCTGRATGQEKRCIRHYRDELAAIAGVEKADRFIAAIAAYNAARDALNDTDVFGANPHLERQPKGEQP